VRQGKGFGNLVMVGSIPCKTVRRNMALGRITASFILRPLHLSEALGWRGLRPGQRHAVDSGTSFHLHIADRKALFNTDYLIGSLITCVTSPSLRLDDSNLEVESFVASTCSWLAKLDDSTTLQILTPYPMMT